MCDSTLTMVRAVGRVVPEVAGAGRRLELMWLGQSQIETTDGYRPVPKTRLIAILQADRGGEA
jgi:hypothetical protein